MKYLVGVLCLTLGTLGCQSPPRNPTGTIEGQIFIRTPAGERIPVGLVDVFAIPKSALQAHLAWKDSVSHAKIDIAAPFIASYLDSLENAEVGPMERSRVRSEAAGRFKSLRRYRTLGYYLSGLPVAVDTARTDASGNFSMRVPARDSLSLVATARRQILDETRQYHWVLPVSVRADSTREVSLTDQNSGFLFASGYTHPKPLYDKAVYFAISAAMDAFSEKIRFEQGWGAVTRDVFFRPDSLLRNVSDDLKKE